LLFEVLLNLAGLQIIFLIADAKFFSAKTFLGCANPVQPNKYSILLPNLKFCKIYYMSFQDFFVSQIKSPVIPEL